jgi:hypothetical protein
MPIGLWEFSQDGSLLPQVLHASTWPYRRILKRDSAFTNFLGGEHELLYEMTELPVVEDFTRELIKRGYKRTRTTSRTVHLRRAAPGRFHEFHLIVRLKNPVDFRLHKDNYAIRDKFYKPSQKASLDLSDGLLLEEFKEIASIFSKTNPRDRFSLACPLCGCKMAYTKLARHIERRGCSPGYGGFLSTLRKLDQNEFKTVKMARGYYLDKYGVGSRTELSTEQIKEEIALRKMKPSSRQG